MQHARHDTHGVHIESSLPKPWEVEATFHDTLYDWMGRAPWLGISGAAHLLLFFILMAIPWDKLTREPEQIIVTQVIVPEELPFEEPPPEEEEPPVEDDVEIEEPRLVEEPTDEPIEDELVDTTAEGDPEDPLDAPFEEAGDNKEIGIGGDVGGGKMGNRGFGRGGGGPRGSGINQAIVAGLEWLKEHQSPDGSWSCEGFSAECGKLGSTICDGAGYATHDVGVTGLALLAFLGMRNTTNEGPYSDVVRRGILWLRAEQDPDNGLIGNRASHEFLYDHALATLALCENYYYTKSPQLKRATQEALNFIALARNDYAAWRYDVPEIGDNDTSVTGWMLFALSAGKDAGLKVDPAALEGGMSWIDEVTDPATGRVGYDGFGSLSSRTPANEHYPREKGEAMTAVGMLCRIFVSDDPENDPIVRKHADLLKRTPPVWDPEGFGCDMYYWYYGTYAMFQMGGSHWKAWKTAMEPAVIKTQRKDGDEKGSWDPVGPWGYAGGRVYSTAIMTLCLEVYFRYNRVFGVR